MGNLLIQLLYQVLYSLKSPILGPNVFFSFCLQKPSIFDSVFIKAKQNPARYGWHLRCNQKSQWLILCVQFTDKWLVIARRRSNSIPWCTSFHVILSLRTWHIMITTLQHARNEHRSARCVWFSNMFRFSSLCFWEYNCIELADIHCALKKNFSVTLRGYICFTDLSRTT